MQPRRRPSSATTRHRLISLAVDLRNAYEDVSLSPIFINEETDCIKLIDLAANPCADVPPEWLPDALQPESPEAQEVDAAEGEFDGRVS